VLTEHYEWIGGQLTSQAVPPDEHPWIEWFGAPASYRRYRDLVRDAYASDRSLSVRARSSLYLNPGIGSVSAISHEPRVGLGVLEGMVRPHVQSGRLRILTGYRPVAADAEGSIVRAVEFEQAPGERLLIEAQVVLDATETGELLPLAGIPYVTGTESRDETGEPGAPEVGDAQSMQGFTVCFAMDYLDGEDHTIERPEQYDRWTGFGAPVRPAPQIGWPASVQTSEDRHRRVLRPNPPIESDADVVVSASRVGRFDPPEGYLPVEDIWRFRRLMARGNFDPQPMSDITLINCSANDYIDGSIVDVDAATASANLESARQLSLSLLYWLQTEAPRADGGFGFSGLRPRGDVLGTDDGLAMAPYIREGRRIRAITTITQNDIAKSVRGDAGATRYEDSVGIGSYKIDLHPGTSGGERRYDAGWPFEIPLGALLPRDPGNVIAAAKNIGTTHITNGCYRVHPVEWSIGEAAGALAAHCVTSGIEPATVHSDPKHLRDFQRMLEQRGVELHWPNVRAY
jgi:hypothetical protein